MSAPLAALPLLFALLASTPAPAQPATEEWDPGGGRHVELTADDAGQVPPIAIGPNRATTFVFHTPLLPGGVVVEGREFFLSVTVDEAAGVVNVLPSGALSPGRELMLTARFADGAVPEWARLRLVVSATRAERQVEVYRQPRSAESYRQAERRERERAERCEARLAQVEAQGPYAGGLTGLFDAGLLGNGKGLAVKNLAQDFTQRPGETLHVQQVWSYRAKKDNTVAVELKVENTGQESWTARGVEGTELVSPESGERLRILRVRQTGPLLPGDEGRLVVEAQALEGHSTGLFVLKLEEADGQRTLTVRKVTFP
ncbi:MAG TPA: DUF2381 family protein [Archangium sp.]|jgi:uncharacterized protein (TIGR02268 family)|uniref:DUF2381 family protein n=1 Tax=Archangium sp. TaxID=1872627 RepID=UPI002EDA7EF5